jgi:hypothetical protein
MPTSYTVRFSERRPNGRLKPLIVQKVGPAPVADIWRWVADMLRGATPDVLERVQEIKVAPDEAPATEEARP